MRGRPWRARLTDPYEAVVVVGDGGRVEGGASVGGTDTVVVGGSVTVLVGGATVVAGGGGVVGVVVLTGGEVVAGVGGVVVPLLRGAVVAMGGRVVAVRPLPAESVGAGVAPRRVVVESTVDDVDVDGPLDVVVNRRVVVGRAVVDGDAWLATTCLGDVSSPVTTSNNMATKATEARA